MHAVILLAGPSLANLDTRPEADVLIGVKRAALRFPCDWCVVLDHPDLKSDWFANVTAPLLLTRREYRPAYTMRDGTDCETLYGLLPHMPTKWACFSSSAALVLAAHLGAETVTAYGADFGESDTLAEFDGYESREKNYTPHRWQFERECWNATATALGLQVTRHGLARRS